MGRPYLGVTSLSNPFLYIKGCMHGINRESFEPHLHHSVPEPSPNVLVPIEAGINQCTSVVSDYPSLLNLFPRKNLIPAVLCSLIHFIAPALIEPHNCASIPSTSKLSSLFTPATNPYMESGAICKARSNLGVAREGITPRATETPVWTADHVGRPSYPNIYWNFCFPLQSGITHWVLQLVVTTQIGSVFQKLREINYRMLGIDIHRQLTSLSAPTNCLWLPKNWQTFAVQRVPGNGSNTIRAGLANLHMICSVKKTCFCSC